MGLPCLSANTSELEGKQLLEANEKHCLETREASLGKRMKTEKEQRAVSLKKSRNLESCCSDVRVYSAPTFALTYCVPGTGLTPLLAECSEPSFFKQREVSRLPNLLTGSFQQTD